MVSGHMNSTMGAARNILSYLSGDWDCWAAICGLQRTKVQHEAETLDTEFVLAWPYGGHCWVFPWWGRGRWDIKNPQGSLCFHMNKPCHTTASHEWVLECFPFDPVEELNSHKKHHHLWWHRSAVPTKKNTAPFWLHPCKYRLCLLKTLVMRKHWVGTVWETWYRR